MGFGGWPDEAIDFYDGLEEDNSKAYWQAHLSVYERAVKAPMEALVSELAGDLGGGRLFRPYRDVRFSADKSPYKTACAASFDSGGYVQLSAAGLGVGRGMYSMAPDQLLRYRQAVDADPSGAALVDAVATLRRAGLDLVAQASLTTSPRGYPRDHPRVELLRLRGLVAWQQWPAGPWLGTARAKTRVVAALQKGEAVSRWLDRHVGPSVVAEPRRR